jgi:hypothetical protein
MSDNTVDFHIAGLELTTHEQSNLAIPSWLPEALLVGQYWQSRGLLSSLQQQVHVNRGRMGQYEVCDFVLLLLAYAVSGLDTLAEFFEQLKPVSSVLMAVWGRQQCPVAATLSRFLAAVAADSVEALRDLFETDLLMHPLPQVQELGVSDRHDNRWVVFDIDGTTKAVRHRALPRQGTHPSLQRRSRNACVPGYSGRKRGEAVRTRTTIEQAHTREWLGTFAGAGNGDSKGDLKRACTLIHRYCAKTELPPDKALLRLDGLYGSANYLSILQQQKVMYITRCRDYHLLKDSTVQTQLKGLPQQQYLHPDSPEISRELFDIECVDATRRGYLDPLRLIVVRMVRFSKQKPSVGKCDGKYLYEVFLTSLPASGFTAADVLSLYNGRGGFEQTLSEEDQEQDCDRWCSWQPEGQSFWQILSQWVWNWRIQAGYQSQKLQGVRQTLWSPALEAAPITSASESATLSTQTNIESAEIPVVTSEPSLAPPPKYGKMIIAPGWGQSRHKYSGKDFKVIEDERIECPAGHQMDCQEIRHNRVGDRQMIFGIKSTVCRDCPLKAHCHADRSSNTRGRRILVTRTQFPTPPPLAEIPDIIIKQSSTPLAVGSSPIIWNDLPATQFRRNLKCRLEQNKVELESISMNLEITDPPHKLLTRHQRAHRRLSWEQRLKRNRLKDETVRWKVQLFGVSPNLAQFLKQPQDKDSRCL